MNQTYVICILFAAALAGVIAGFYIGMSVSVWLYESKQKKLRRMSQKNNSPHEKNKKPDVPAKPAEPLQELNPAEMEENPDNPAAEEISHSYMGFICDNEEQDAVSKIRAARKTQDDKYMSRANKRKKA